MILASESPQPISASLIASTSAGTVLSRNAVQIGTLELGQRAAELIFKQIGENPKRDGLKETPRRFAKAIEEICSGYQKTLAQVVGEGLFPAEGSGLVSVRNIEFFSLCEHHMLPFWGKVSVAYFPEQQILGLSKVARIVELFARRLQVQERLTREISLAMSETLTPKAVGVRIRAAHTCMMMRGIGKQASETVTEFFSNIEELKHTERERLLRSLDD